MDSSGPRSTRLRRGVALVSLAALGLAACGGDDSTTSDDVVDSAADGAVETVTTDVTSDSGAAGSEAPAEAGAQGLQQNGPITVTGTPLDPFEMSGADDPSIGTEAPVVEGESFDGTAMTIGGPTENPTMVVFLAHWCPHCNEEVPVLISLDDDGSLPDDLDVIGVSTAVDAEAPNYPPSEWIDDRGWPWPTMADDDALTAISAMGGTSFPFLVVLDTDGTVLARRAGQATGPDTIAFLEDALSRRS